MSFTDGKPWVVTEKDCRVSWAGGKNGKYFLCGLCGYKFKPGDTVRWQYTNDVQGASGNPLVCVECDGTKEEIVIKYKKLHEDFNKLKKIFHQDCDDCQGFL
jgi:hypothetical protein